MLLLTAFAATLSSAPSPHPPVRAQATVRIARAVRVTKEDWGQSARKREVTIVENGQPLRIRLVEFE